MCVTYFELLCITKQALVVEMIYSFAGYWLAIERLDCSVGRWSECHIRICHSGSANNGLVSHTDR